MSRHRSNDTAFTSSVERIYVFRRGIGNWLPEIGYRGQSNTPYFPDERGKWFTVIKRLGQGCVRVKFDESGKEVRMETIHIHRPELRGDLLRSAGQIGLFALACAVNWCISLYVSGLLGAWIERASYH